MTRILCIALLASALGGSAARAQATPAAPPTPAPAAAPAPAPAPPPAPSVPSAATDQRLVPTHPSSLAGQIAPVESEFDRSMLQLMLHGDLGVFGPTSGLYVSGSVTLLRAMRLELGVVTGSYAPCMSFSSNVCVRESATFASHLAFGAQLAILQVATVELSGGVLATTDGWVSPAVRLAIPLDLPFLPVKLPDARIRLGYPVAIGFEWGQP